MRYWDLTEWIMFSVVGLLILGIIFLVLDVSIGKSITVDATVLEKAYSPAKTGVGTGIANTGSGSGVAVVVTSESEKYTLICAIGENVCSESVSAKTYAMVNKGDKIRLSKRVGKFTGWWY